MNESLPEAQTPTPEIQTQKNSNLILVLLLLLTVLSASVSVYLFIVNQTLTSRLQQLESSSETVDNQTIKTQDPANETVTLPTVTEKEMVEDGEGDQMYQNWEEFSSESMHFSIRIPSGWRVVEQENRVGFGPKEVGEDVLVAIQTYPKNEKSLAEISDEFGKQFSDRVQESNTIAVNGLVATEVITTTPSYEDWYYRSVIIIKDDVIYVFSNGAITDSSIQGFRGVPVDYTFEKFIQSFHIIP